MCARCGRESPDEFGFCPACGAPLAGAERRQVRKVVSILFCDLTGSTALGDRSDPEALRLLMTRYYDTSRAVLERHGGMVEKFVGDAVMAVFGIPVATENDALRAVRAAVELRETVHDLGLEARIGVNTGDVVAGEGDTLVTGDAVNVAARLEQSAAAGDLLVGETTLSLVRDAVTTEAVELSLRGKPASVTAYRLLTMDQEASGFVRHLERPMVGRIRELGRLSADFADAAASRSSRLFTLIGPAGVGKSRLVADFLATVGEHATVAHGRALSYGDGITYWPLVEMLIQLGVDPDEAIRLSPADTQLATRALFEQLADYRPLILVLDDLQWAAPPMLDLVEHIVDWSRDAPILLLCVARAELLDVRPGWGGGKVNATSVLLEPLEVGEAEELADSLLEGVAADSETRHQILSIAEGNPLFLEEMAALARDADGAVTVPPTIRALLQARLDTLNDAERIVIERGAVEGEVFHRGSVTALVPAAVSDGVASQLIALVRKELVRPHRSQIVGDDAFRFRHLLIRDTAYDSLPKAVRADLHERFADWSDSYAGLPELDEIVGYHLERSARYLRELGLDVVRSDRLAERAGERLATAGLAAIERGDVHAVCNLLSRAVALLPDGARRQGVIPHLVEGLYNAGRRSEISPLIEELDRGSDADRATACVLRVLTGAVSPASSANETRPALDAAGQILVGADVEARARYERARATAAHFVVDAVAAHEANWRAYQLARSVGRRDLVRDLLLGLVKSAHFSGDTASELREILAELEEWVADKAGPLFAAELDQASGTLEFNAGTITAGEQRRRSQHCLELLRQTGELMTAIDMTSSLEYIAWAEGDLVTAERIERDIIAEYERIGDRNYLINSMARWALTKSRLGEPDVALDIVAQAREIGSKEDVADQIGLDLAEAHARTRHGNHAAGRSALESARRRAAGIRMRELEEEIAMVEGELALMTGDRSRAAEIADRIAADADRRGFHRYADALRRTILGPS